MLPPPQQPPLPPPQQPPLPPPQQPPLSSYDTIRVQLSTHALNDFMSGHLSESLKRELMILRVQKRRELTEFYDVAVTIVQNEKLADWIEQLNPTMIPEDVRREAYQGATFIDDNNPHTLSHTLSHTQQKAMVSVCVNADELPSAPV